MRQTAITAQRTIAGWMAVLAAWGLKDLRNFEKLAPRSLHRNPR
jgi:hypothetical protein